MRTAYRVLAYLVAVEVLIQAGAIAYAFFGMSTWIEGGGVLDKAGIESESLDFTGVGGFPVHFINGQIVIPLIALILLIVSFFARVKGAAKWAGIVLGLVVVQVLLGVFARGVTALGFLHGLNALALFLCALIAARLGADAPGGHRTRVAERADIS